VTHRWTGHTAELVLELDGSSPEAVLAEAAEALGGLLELEPSGGERSEHELELEAPDLGSLLVDLLEELVFLADTEGFVATRAEVTVEPPARLRARLAGRRTEVRQLVKAATYSELAFGQRGDLWHARVVLDV
jgi:SHS2 domain-containing protein